MTDAGLSFVRSRSAAARPPPKRDFGALGWARRNLFSSPASTAATLVSALVLAWVIPPLIRWAFLDAVWVGGSRDACAVDGAGACWAFIRAKFAQFIYGRYPIAERWRVDLGFVLLVAGLVPMAIPRIPFKRENALYLLIVFPVVTYILLVGGVFGLPPVETALWGGLLVTLVVAIVGMVVSLPLGVVLALGRRSQLPVVRSLSIGFIEFWRGVPLITVLFMASVMLPLFLPSGTNFDQLLKALVGVALFSSAYMAETVRGGLQAIPRGQYEGAMALGLSYWQRMRLVILPQALRLVIPGIVNSFISLFKDTSLVAIIGIHDFLGIIQLNFSDPNWLSPATPISGYVFAAFVYWMFCFGMSRYSIFMEKRLNAGRRR